MPRILPPAAMISLWLLGLAACSPGPEQPVATGESDAAPAVAPVPGTVEIEAPVASGEVSPRLPAPSERSRRRRGPDGGDQTQRGLEQRMLAGFDRLDIDADGQLTPDELAAGDGPGGARMLRRADADGNGTLTRDEVRQAAIRLFALMDADGDGVITEDERPERGPRR